MSVHLVGGAGVRVAEAGSVWRVGRARPGGIVDVLAEAG